MTIEGDFDELAAAIAELEQLASVGERAAAIAAPAIERVARAQWASGTSPDGVRWPRTKDGRVALTALTARVTFTVEGDELVLRGPDELAYHARTRPAFPERSGALPGPWQLAADSALQAAAERRR